VNKRDFFLLGANLMREEIEDRLVEDPEALAPVRVRGYPWGYALRLRADARLGFGCRDEEFAELRYGAGRELQDVQREHDRKHDYYRSASEAAYLPETELPWAVGMGELFAQREIDEYLDAGGPSNQAWSWEHRGGLETYARVKAFLATRFDSGPCHLEAIQARNKYLIRWSESDHPDAIKVREYAARFPLFAPVPGDEIGNIGVTPCVLAGEVSKNKYGWESVRVILPLGFKWSSLARTQLMELKPEAGPPRFFGDNWIVHTPERNGIFEIYKHGVHIPPYYKLTVGLRVTNHAGNRHGTVARRCRHNCAFIKWDDQDRVDYGVFGDWSWWWNLKPEAA